MAEWFSCCRVVDADVEVRDEEDDGGCGVGSAYADVMESAGVAEGDDSVGADDVLSDPVVAGGLVCGGGFGEPGVGDGGGCSS